MSRFNSQAYDLIKFKSIRYQLNTIYIYIRHSAKQIISRVKKSLNYCYNLYKESVGTTLQ